jgi:hypothetical protein
MNDMIRLHVSYKSNYISKPPISQVEFDTPVGKNGDSYDRYLPCSGNAREFENYTPGMLCPNIMSSSYATFNVGNTVSR